MSVIVENSVFLDGQIASGFDIPKGIGLYIQCIVDMVIHRFNGYVEKERLLKIAFESITDFLADGDGCFDPNCLLKYILNNIFTGIDSYSTFQESHTAEITADNMEGCWHGIGLWLARTGEKIVVSKVHPSTPADRAGICTGDILIAINGQPVDTRDMMANYDMFDAQSDGRLMLDIIKKGSDKVFSVSMSKQKIINGNVMYRIENSIGYIKIYSFNKHTAECVGEILDKMDDAGIKRIILDLRHNTGGILKQAVLTAGRFVPEGLIVKLKFKSCLYEDIEYLSDLKNINYKLAVLVNDGTVSSSEILAGAIQDTKSGVLVGTRTHGKTAVQKTIPLLTYEAFTRIKSITDEDIADANELKVKYGIEVPADELIGAATLTVGEYITPKGRIICGKGIEPDFYIEDEASFRETNKYGVRRLDGTLEFSLNDECIEIFFAKIILRIAGYGIAAIDDKFDESIESAILKFQSDRLLRTSGILDLPTQKALNDLIEPLVLQKDLQYAKALQVLKETDTMANRYSNQGKG